ncbi:hypothetical protein OESDEN_09298, partial [Oesophagostomum dentatum]
MDDLKGELIAKRVKMELTELKEDKTSLKSDTRPSSSTATIQPPQAENDLQPSIGNCPESRTSSELPASIPPAFSFIHDD